MKISKVLFFLLLAAVVNLYYIVVRLERENEQLLKKNSELVLMLKEHQDGLSNCIDYYYQKTLESNQDCLSKVDFKLSSFEESYYQNIASLKEEILSLVQVSEE